MLDPDVVLRADGGSAGVSHQIRGAQTVARGALMFSREGLTISRVLVNGAPGLISVRAGNPVSLWTAAVREGRISEINILTDPERLALAVGD